MLAARDKNEDQVHELETGADYYVAKPGDPRVLLARIRKLFTHSAPVEPRHDKNRIVLGQLVIDLSERKVRWREQAIELYSGEYDLLLVLAKGVGQVLNREQLIQELGSIEFNGVDRSVDMTISKLRRKFGDDPSDPRKIKTVWGRGYLFSQTEWEE